MKRVYVRHEDGGRTFSSVEEEVLEHYRIRGYSGEYIVSCVPFIEQIVEFVG